LQKSQEQIRLFFTVGILPIINLAFTRHLGFEFYFKFNKDSSDLPA
jgi:hypothetical protein